MERLNEKAINIDKSGDELILSLHIFNSNQYDLMNKRMKETDSVVELNVYNNSEKDIRIKNPELLIIDMSSRNSILKRYNSSRLNKEFPLTIRSKTDFQFAYNSKKLIALLRGFVGEDVKFQIQDINGNYYESLFASGDDFESYLLKRNENTSWKHKDVYEFDNEMQ